MITMNIFVLALKEAVAERNPQRIKKLFKEIVGFNLSGQLKDLVSLFLYYDAF